MVYKLQYAHTLRHSQSMQHAACQTPAEAAGRKREGLRRSGVQWSSSVKFQFFNRWAIQYPRLDTVSGLSTSNESSSRCNSPPYKDSIVREIRPSSVWARQKRNYAMSPIVKGCYDITDTWGKTPTTRNLGETRSKQIARLIQSIRMSS